MLAFFTGIRCLPFARSISDSIACPSCEAIKTGEDGEGGVWGVNARGSTRLRLAHRNWSNACLAIARTLGDARTRNSASRFAAVCTILTYRLARVGVRDAYTYETSRGRVWVHAHAR